MKPVRKRSKVIGTVATPTVARYLSGAEWHWNEIPANPVLDANSAAMVTTLNSATGNTNRVIANYEYGVPMWEILEGETAPSYNIPMTRYNIRTLNNVRIPDSAAPQPGSPASNDGAMVVLDWGVGKIYEFYEMWKNGSSWTASAGSVYPMTGVGTNDSDIGIGAVGAGVSRASGIIRRSELEAAWPNGYIPHALVFSTNMSAPTVFRYPAVKTDGSNMEGGANPIPEGARVQLDPTYDVDGSAMNTMNKVVARTLQRYGAYNIDNGGSRMAFMLEADDVNSSTYNPPVDAGNPAATGGWARAYGMTSSYFSLSGIPWGSLRVLKKWDGSA